MKKEILHVVESFSGGVYDFIVSLINGLPEYNHTILYGKRTEIKENFQEDFSKNIKFIYWKNANREIKFQKDFQAGIELYKILSNQNYDKIHLHSSKAGFLGRIVGKIKKQEKNIIYTTHGVSFLRKDVSKFKRSLYICLEMIGMIMGGEIIACSKSEAEFMKKMGISKARYINNGIDLFEIPLELKKDEKCLNIVTAGRITHQKNPKLFNEIAEKFLDNKKIKFIWIGDGELKKELRSPNICITGWKNQDDVLKELSKGDIYISTSLWEGLSLAILQAMSVGLPLVLTNCVGNVDLVEEGKNGFLIEDSKGILDIVDKTLSLKKEKYSIKVLEKKFLKSKMLKYYRSEFEK